MIKYWLVLCGIMLISSLTIAQQVSEGGIQRIKAFYERDNDTTYIVNFWATWCGPCVEELPVFDTLKAENKEAKLCILLVSLDFKKDFTTKVIPFIKKKGILAPVIRMSDIDANVWIPQVSEQWTGSIPGTLVVNKKSNFKHFVEGELTYEELSRIFKQSIK